MSSLSSTYGWRPNVLLPFVHVMPDGSWAVDPSVISVVGGIRALQLRSLVGVGEPLLRQLVQVAQPEPGLWDASAPVNESTSQLLRLSAFLSLQFLRLMEDGSLLFYSRDGSYQQSALLLWHTGLHTKGWEPVYLLCKLNAAPELPTQKWAAAALATSTELSQSAWWQSQQLGVEVTARMVIREEDDHLRPPPADPWSQAPSVRGGRLFDRSLPVRCTDADLASLLRDSPPTVAMVPRGALEVSIALACKAARAQPGACSARLHRDVASSAPSRPRVQLLLPLWIAGGPTLSSHGADITRADGALAIDLRPADAVQGGYVYVPAAVLEPQTALLEARLFGPLYHSWLRARSVPTGPAPAPPPTTSTPGVQLSQAGSAPPRLSVMTSQGGPLFNMVGGSLGFTNLSGDLAAGGGEGRWGAGGAAVPLMVRIEGGLGNSLSSPPPLASLNSSGSQSSVGGSALFDFSTLQQYVSSSQDPAGGLDGLPTLPGLTATRMPGTDSGHVSGLSGSGEGAGLGLGALPLNLDLLLSTRGADGARKEAVSRSVVVSATHAQQEASVAGGEESSDQEEDEEEEDEEEEEDDDEGSAARDAKWDARYGAGSTGAAAHAPSHLASPPVPSTRGGSGNGGGSKPGSAPAPVATTLHDRAGLAGTQHGGAGGKDVSTLGGKTASAGVMADKKKVPNSTAVASAMPPTSTGGVKGGVGGPPWGGPAGQGASPLPVAPLPAALPGGASAAGSGSVSAGLAPAVGGGVPTWAHTRYKGSVLSIVLKEEKPHGFISVTRKREPDLWSRVNRESPDTMRLQDGKEVATIVFQAPDMEDAQGMPLAVETAEGTKLAAGHYKAAVTALGAWKGAEVTFEAEYSFRFRRFIAHHVRAVPPK